MEITSGSRPDRPHLTKGNERSLVYSVYNRIAMDVAEITFSHVWLDENKRYRDSVDSSLNNCLTCDANIDQTGRAMMQDAVLTMLDKGCAAFVPVDTDVDPHDTSSYEILTMRVGTIVNWMPDRVRVDVYNDRSGHHEQVVVPKRNVAIVENPFYAIMNESSSTLQRLIRKLNVLDVIDEKTSNGQLDLIIQLPYAVNRGSRQQLADDRLKEIQEQLNNSRYGIAYIGSTEKVTQLNRPVENNLLSQIQYLTELFYSQLGISKQVMDGTADEQQSLNYMTKTIEPIASAIADEMTRKFLTKTARTQGQAIAYFRDPFKLVPVNNIADIADKFARNEILSANEIRQIIGMKPSADPKADELRNATISENAIEQYASRHKTANATPMDVDSNANQSTRKEPYG